MKARSLQENVVCPLLFLVPYYSLSPIIPIIPIIVINVKEVSTHELAWAVGIHLTLVFSGVMFALMDRISGTTHGGGEK